MTTEQGGPSQEDMAGKKELSLMDRVKSMKESNEIGPFLKGVADAGKMESSVKKLEELVTKYSAIDRRQEGKHHEVDRLVNRLEETLRRFDVRSLKGNEGNAKAWARDWSDAVDALYDAEHGSHPNDSHPIWSKSIQGRYNAELIKEQDSKD
ncbi:MAG: hypothetical protein Q7S48_01570 [bacterium]|nr:hypothetical protein [bacterium]